MQAEQVSTVAAGAEMAVVDAVGCACPGPLLMARKALSATEVKGRFELRSSDPGTCADIVTWCQREGATLESVKTSEAGIFSFVIRKNR